MPQDAWKQKRERQYRHVKKSEMERGRSESRAKEIAARVVNDTRRAKNETKSDKKRTSGTGNPNVELGQRTKAELYNRAKELDIAGRSRMAKAELVRAIRRRS